MKRSSLAKFELLMTLVFLLAITGINGFLICTLYFIFVFFLNYSHCSFILKLCSCMYHGGYEDGFWNVKNSNKKKRTPRKKLIMNSLKKIKNVL